MISSAPRRSRGHPGDALAHDRLALHLRLPVPAPFAHPDVHPEHLAVARGVHPVRRLNRVPDDDAFHPGHFRQRRLEDVAVALRLLRHAVIARPHHGLSAGDVHRRRSAPFVPADPVRRLFVYALQAVVDVVGQHAAVREHRGPHGDDEGLVRKKSPRHRSPGRESREPRELRAGAAVR
eukprot:31202-Pelagococcus_subviridis.AAC.4